MSWIAVAVGAASAISGSVQANANRQRQKGIIGKAYDTAQARMSAQQAGYARAGGRSASGQRGLDQTAASVTGSDRRWARRDAGRRQAAQCRSRRASSRRISAREQTINEAELRTRKCTADLSNVNAEANAGMIGAVEGGVQTAFGVKGALNEAGAMPGRWADETRHVLRRGESLSEPRPRLGDVWRSRRERSARPRRVGESGRRLDRRA